MNRLPATFEKSAAAFADCPADDIVEVAFAGRSNAGKSSVLNMLVGQRALARVSRTPGRTQLINFFRVGSGGRLVDLPGYGYAVAAQRTRDRWQQNVNVYLSQRTNLRGLVLVMDIRHPLKDSDQLALAAAAALQLPALALLNKSDKLSQAQCARALAAVRAVLPDSVATLVFSAHNGTGLDALVEQVRAWLTPAPDA